MEVHAHSHTARKKWTHYFWEFIMLFLAVFCGFLAEYQLEHKIEKAREKQYIKSFVEDLEADTADFNQSIVNQDDYLNIADSLIILLNSSEKNRYANDIYFFLRKIHRSSQFNVNDRTIIQLRNAGGMRLVTNKSVSDSMIDYYKIVDNIKFVYEEQTSFKRSLRPFFSELLYGTDFGKVIDENNRVIRSGEPLQLKPAGPETINSFILILQNIKGITISSKSGVQNLKRKAIRIRNYIIKEYHLQ
jgi:hypothetical protein